MDGLVANLTVNVVRTSYSTEKFVFRFFSSHLKSCTKEILVKSFSMALAISRKLIRHLEYPVASFNTPLDILHALCTQINSIFIHGTEFISTSLLKAK